MADVNKDSMMFKIKALIDKANSTDSIEEANSFMAKAQELLAKHNLDVSHVMTKEQVQEQGVEETLVGYEDYWEAMLAHYICESNLCRLVLKSYSKKVCIIGRPSNVVAVVYLFEFYRGAIIGLSLKRYDEFVKEFIVGIKMTPAESRKQKASFIENYIKGCVDGVNDQMKKQHEASMIDLEMKGMVLHNTDIVQEYMNENYPNLGRSSGGYSSGSGGSYNSGKNDGGGIGSRADTSQSSSQRRLN